MNQPYVIVRTPIRRHGHQWAYLPREEWVANGHKPQAQSFADTMEEATALCAEYSRRNGCDAEEGAELIPEPRKRRPCLRCGKRILSTKSHRMCHNCTTAVEAGYSRGDPGHGMAWSDALSPHWGDK